MMSQTVPEGGYGWAVVAVTFFTTSLMAILMASFPVMYNEYMYAFDSGAVLVGTVFSYHVIAIDISGFLFSGFLRHIDLRIMAATSSLISALSCFAASFSNNISMLAFCYALSGAGFGVSYISISPVVHQYFYKRRTLVSGITTAGVGLGSFTFPQLARFSVDFFGWRGAVRIFAALIMQNVWLCTLQRPRIIAHKRTSDEFNTTQWQTKLSHYIKSMFDLKMLKNPGYGLYFVGLTFINVGYTGCIMHITNKCLTHGIDQYRAALAPSVFGIINLIWRPIFGMIATKALLRNNTCVILAVAAVFMGVAIALVAATSTFLYIIIAIIPVSIGLATIVTVFQPSVVALVGLENMSRLLSALMPAIGAGQFIASPFTAWLFEVSGSYTLPYIVLGGTSVLGGLAFLLIGPLSRKYPYVLHDPSVEEKTCEQFEEAQNVTDFTDAV